MKIMGEEIENTNQQEKGRHRAPSHMNTNPFPSQNTTSTDAKSHGRSRVKLAVYSVVAVHVAGLVALLLTQGCRQQKPEEPPVTEQPTIDTNQPIITDTNYGYIPPVSSNVPPPYVEPPPPPPPVASTYAVKAGDSFTTIAAANQTTIKAITAANPGVDSRKLKIGQKLNLPAPGAAVSTPVLNAVDANTYVVKSGDTLGKIAKDHGTTVSAIKALNGLATDKINVKQILKLPPKAATSTEVPPLMSEPAPAPAAPALAPAQ